MAYTFDEQDRAEMDAACRAVAALMLKKNNWRSAWRVDIDGCVFRVVISGYPKEGSDRHRQRQAEIAESVAEFEATHGKLEP